LFTYYSGSGVGERDMFGVSCELSGLRGVRIERVVAGLPVCLSWRVHRGDDILIPG